MNCSGEEQERLLSLLEQEEARRKKTNQNLKDQRNGEPLGLFRLFIVYTAVCLTSAHLATVYPAFAAQECYLRIDRRLRMTLRRKQIPMVGVASSSFLPLRLECNVNVYYLFCNHKDLVNWYDHTKPKTFLISLLLSFSQFSASPGQSFLQAYSCVQSNGTPTSLAR